MIDVVHVSDAGKLRRPRALLLDLDDTLLDNRGIPESVSRTCDSITEAFPGFDPQQLRDANAEVWPRYWREVESLCWLGKMEGFAVSHEAWRLTLDACGCVDSSIVDFAFEHHRQFGREAQRLFPDAEEFLLDAAVHGMRLALVTNGASDLQRDKIRVLGLDESFDCIIISGEVAVAKPDPATFRLALEPLGVEPRDAWHIGDSLITDVAGAQAAGVGAVWLNRNGTSLHGSEKQPDIEVASLTEATVLLG